jgi:hypothetical protein
VCSGCSARIAAPDTAAGKTVRCPKCKASITVPAPAPAEFEVVEDDPKPAAQKPTAPAKATPTPKPRPAVVDEDADEDDRPRKKKADDEDDEDNRPRKKKKADEDEEEEDEDRPRKKKKADEDEEEEDRPRKKKPAADEDEDEDDDRPRKKKDEDEDDDRPRKKKKAAVDDDEDEDEDRPRKRGKKRPQKAGPSPGLLVGGIAAAVLLLGGVGFAVYWFAIREKAPETVSTGGGSNTPGGTGSGGKAPVPTGWIEVAPPRAGFKAYMPAKPFGADAAPVKPLAGSKMATIANYPCQSPDTKIMCTIIVLLFPDAMTAAEREKAVVDRIEAGAPKAFVKQLSRGKSTLGGKEATEIVEEVDFAGLMGGKPGPKGEKLPDKVVGVTRYCIVGGRAYVAEIVKSDARPTEAEEKGFFDNFELVPETDTSGPPQKSITRNWKDFTAPAEFGFKARFPWYSPPTPPSPWAPPPKGSTSADQFQVQFSEPGEVLTHFAVVVVRFQPGLTAAGREKTLDDLVRLMSLSPDLKPSAPRSITWVGRPATEVTYEMAQPGPNGRKTRIVMRRLITDTTAYIAFVREHGGVRAEDLATFFDSFALTK